MPFDHEDTHLDISGDQPTTPLSQKQIKGAQSAAVNRTQLPSANKGPAPQPPSADGKADGEGDKKPAAAQQQPEGQAQGPQLLGQTIDPIHGLDLIKQEADQAIGLNPAHQQDWAKHAIESPAETYFLGKHIWNAFYGAFLDPSAIQASVHDIWHQDDAAGWLMRNIASNPASPIAAAAHGAGTTPENMAAGAAGTVLPIGADPTNLMYMGAGGRGAMMVAKFLTPSAANAIFTGAHSPSDLAWAVLPAILFGGKLPPSAIAGIEKVAPGATKIFDKLSAAKMAQERNKTEAQDGKKMIERLLATGAMPAKAEPLARAWEPDMKGLTKEQHYQLVSSINEKYGTLDVEKVISRMIAEGVGVRMLNRVWQKLYKMNYDLVLRAPEEAALVDPRQHIHDMPGELAQKVEDGFQWTAHFVHQSHMATSGHATDPVVSHFRSLLGLQTTDKFVEKQFYDHLVGVAGKQATNPHEWDLLGKALESSGHEQEAAYQSLSPEMKYVRDSMRMVAAGVGQSAESLGLIERVNNYWPRVGLVTKTADGKFRGLRRGSARPLTTEPQVHRALRVRTVDLLTESRMQVEQSYATVKEANAAVLRQRAYVADSILNGTPWHEIVGETGAGVPRTDRELIDQIKTLAVYEPEIARIEADRYAKDLIPEFSENPFDGIAKLGNQLRAVTSRQAVEDLKMMTGKDGKQLAIDRPTNDRAYDKAKKDGYRAISIGGFQHVMVTDQYAKLLEDATQAHNTKSWQKLTELENQAVTMIMYSPRIHGMNMAARLAVAFARHPMEVSRWFKEGLMQPVGKTRIGPEAYRMEPWQKGVVPPNPHLPLAGGMMADAAISQPAQMFNDIDQGRRPLVRDMSNSDAVQKASSGAKLALGKVRDIAWGRQSDLWSWVSDFGVMMYWIEKASAQRGGMLGTKLSEEEASRYAVARANSWMGHVSPVDWNPNVHAALKTALFAPNWWRTWGELLTGYYRNQGFGWSSDTIKYIVENEVKTAMAAVLFQQLSANALNMVFSGHTIYQNDPGNWGKIEITAPWAIEILNHVHNLGIDPKTGRDAKGAKLTWENPVARQTVDAEQMMGMLTSAHNWSPDTMRQGFSSFAAARTSPIMSAIFALGNVDLYRSISADQLRYVDPNHDTLAGNPLADLITAAGDMTPFSYISQNIQQQIMQGNVQDVKGPAGLPIPKAILDSVSLQSLGGDAMRSFLVGLTGTNPPFMRSSKTQGASPTDDQYKAVHEIQSTYQQQMNALSTATLSGQLAPYQWLAAYRPMAQRHAAEMQAIFKHSPEYNNGPLGLTHSYEALYDQATNAQGILQPDKLRELQHQWKAENGQASFAAVQSELRGNDHKYPMLALYHKTLDAYDNWQRDWSTQNGVDLATLQSELSGYAQVYNDRTASRAWLVEHPDITAFESAKRSEFEAGNSTYGAAGLMYALFFNPTAADRYLLTSGETAEQVEQQVTAQQVAPVV